MPEGVDDVVAVDLVADLLALVAEDGVGAFAERGEHEIVQEAVEFDAGVLGAGEAATAEDAGFEFDAVVLAVLLGEDVAGGFAGTEEGVFGLVD